MLRPLPEHLGAFPPQATTSRLKMLSCAMWTYGCVQQHLRATHVEGLVMRTIWLALKISVRLCVLIILTSIDPVRKPSGHPLIKVTRSHISMGTSKILVISPRRESFFAQFWRSSEDPKASPDRSQPTVGACTKKPWAC